MGIFTNEIYLPAGTWTDAWTGERIVSKGETFTREYPADRAGLLFIRDGAIIPTQGDVSYIGTRPFEKITLNVYPHGDSQFTLMDDDGETYGYEKGAIAKTLVECHEKGGASKIIVNPVAGSYEGMPGTREYSFAVQNDGKASSVLVGGKELKDWTYKGGMIRFSLDPVAVSDKIVIDIL